MASRSILTVCLILGLMGASNACGIWGQLFCDYCWDGQFTSGVDVGIGSATVNANCTILKNNVPVYYWGSDVTSTSSLTKGYFEVPIQGTSNKFGKSDAEASFLYVLFKNSAYTRGMNDDVKVVGCSVSISNAGACSTLSLDNGVFLTNGKQGNGWTSNVAVAQYLNTDAADIYIGTGGKRTISVSATPPTKGQGAPSACPVASPPPPGLKGDPHFTGADGSHFDFTGEPGNSYCLVSDSHVHVNAFYGGRFDQWGDNPSKALTWIRKLGILWGEHKITLAAREGARWQYDNGYMASIQVDGEEVRLSGEGESLSFGNGAIEISWLAAEARSGDDLVDVYLVKIAQVLMMRLTLRPEVANLRTEEDGVVHFDVEFPKVDLSANAHGVLGQTFRADHRHRLNKQKLEFSKLLNTKVVPGDNAEGFLDGSVEDYKSSGLLSADCKMGRFSGALIRGDGAKGYQLTSGTAFGGSASLSRKLLKKKTSGVV